MKNYELVYIIHPDLESTLNKVIDKVNGFITKREGKITQEDNWGKRKLAYPIKKQEFGIYVVTNFEMEPKEVADVEKNILLSEEIIRHLLVVEEAKKPSKEKIAKISEEKKPEAKPRFKKEEKKAPVKKSPKESEKEEKERQKKIDEKLEELLGKDEEK